MKNILVPVDFSAANAALAEFAAKLARPFRGRIWLLHCIDRPLNRNSTDRPGVRSVSDDEVNEQYLDEYRELAALASRLRMDGADIQLVFVHGPVVDAILAAADQHRVDVIVMGSQGHDAVWEHEVGSTTEGVLNRSGRPVLVVPSEAAKPRRRMLTFHDRN